MEIRFSEVSLLVLTVACILSRCFPRNQAQLEDWSKYFDFPTCYLFGLGDIEKFFLNFGIASGHYTKWTKNVLRCVLRN